MGSTSSLQYAPDNESRSIVKTAHQNFLGTIACLMAFGINYHASQLQVPNAVYIVFTCIMASNIFTALFLIKDPSQVRRKDGRKVPHYLHKGLWVELRSQLKLLKDWRMLVLVVPFFASEIAIIITSTLNGKRIVRNPYQSLGV